MCTSLYVLEDTWCNTEGWGFGTKHKVHRRRAGEGVGIFAKGKRKKSEIGCFWVMGGVCVMCATGSQVFMAS